MPKSRSDAETSLGVAPEPIMRKRVITRPRQQFRTSAAQKEIDSRLAQALRERADAMKKVSALVYYQDRLNRLNQEIDTLISYQQRLLGHEPTTMTVGASSYVTGFQMGSGPSPAFSHLADLPPGIGSMPTKAPKPAATPNGNAAAEVSSESGFN